MSQRKLLVTVLKVLKYHLLLHTYANTILLQEANKCLIEEKLFQFLQLNRLATMGKFSLLFSKIKNTVWFFHHVFI